MSETIVGSLIDAFQAIVIAALGVFSAIMIAKLKSVEKDVTATRDSVVNHHQTPVRDDMDVIRDEQRRFMRSQAHTNFEVEMKLDHLVDLGQENRRRIVSLEQTEVTRRKRNGKPELEQHPGSVGYGDD